MSKLDTLISHAADLLLALRRLERNPKLSAKGWLRECCELAGCDEKELASILARIEGSTALHFLKAFVLRLSREFSQPTYTRVPPLDHVEKTIRAYGSEQLPHELSEAGLKASQAIAAGALRAVEKWPEQFPEKGPDNFEQHQSQIAKLRADLAAIEKQMRTAWTPADVTTIEVSVEGFDLIKQEDGTTARRYGTRKESCVRFRRREDLGPAMNDWPRKLIEDQFGKDPGRITAEARREAVSKGAGVRVKGTNKVIKAKPKQRPVIKQVTIPADLEAASP